MSALLELERYPDELEPYREAIEERIEQEAAQRGEEPAVIAIALVMIFLAALHQQKEGSKTADMYKTIGQAFDLLPPTKPFHQTAGVDEWIQRLNHLGDGLPPLKALPDKALRRSSIYEDAA